MFYSDVRIYDISNQAVRRIMWCYDVVCDDGLWLTNHNLITSNDSYSLSLNFVSPSVRLSIFFFTEPYLSVCLSVCLSLYLADCLSVCLSVCLSACLSVCLTVHLSVWLSVSMSVCLSVYLAACLSVCLTIWLGDRPSIGLYEYLFTCLSVFPSIFLSACPCLCWGTSQVGNGILTSREMPSTHITSYRTSVTVLPVNKIRFPHKRTRFPAHIIM